MSSSGNGQERKSRAQLHLQLRARALLFDKAAVSLFLRSFPSPRCSRLSPAYLQLHPDDVYFSLEEDHQEWTQMQESSVLHNLGHSKAAQVKGQSNTNQMAENSSGRISSGRAKANEAEVDDVRPGTDGFPETWYNHWSKNHRGNRVKWIAWRFSQCKLPFGDREFSKRTSDGMSVYMNCLDKHKRRREVFEDKKNDTSKSNEESAARVNSKLVPDFSLTDDEVFFPETMFPFNSVPDRAVPFNSQPEEKPKVEFVGILDTLPHAVSLSPMMIERFGMRPEDLNMGMGRNKLRGRNRQVDNWKPLSEEQASCLIRKATVRILEVVGFEGATTFSMEVLSQFIRCHICKISQMLKVLTDSYRKQCSSMELLKMFLQAGEHSNLASLAEYMKDTMKVPAQNMHQQPARDFQVLNQHSLLQPQQIQRQMHPQLHMLHPDNSAVQQHLDKLRRRQASTQVAGMLSEKERNMVNVKVENTDGGFTNSLMNKQVQFKQQQMAMAAQQPHSMLQYKQMGSLHVPQMPSPSMFNMRTPPVKVDGFQELMGGDMSLKHDLEDGRDNKLTSPSKKVAF
ncbi:hypothetical protein EJ110_NYTH35995 [Nymphaea thermarum]|nr:hypothetical protein EJ110_NYTH35995 [Nymphaea thermarum]